eukprot:COSAG01_NODE_883_length_12927_cov_10.710789_7_plen_285_part_00
MLHNVVSYCQLLMFERISLTSSCCRIVYALDFNHTAPLQIALNKAGLTWSDADITMDRLQPDVLIPTSPRGVVAPGSIYLTECFSLWAKAAHVLCGGAAGVDADEIAASLPSWEEYISLSNAGLPFAYIIGTGGDMACVSLLIATVHERLGRVEEALVWAERIATVTDIRIGGTLSPNVHARGLQMQGRCFAATGRPAEAETALVAAAAKLEAIGYYLGEVLALRDLYVCVFKKSDRQREGMVQLRAAIVRLVGEDAAPEQLKVLATALGEEVDLTAVLECNDV